MTITLKDIQNAREVIKGYVKNTDLDRSRSCSSLVGSDVYLKFENLQVTGSFKIRGATNKIHSLSPDERARGVVASSAGNHAQGVALAAKIFGVRAKIVMPVNAPMVKVEATRAYGAEVVLHGNYYDECYQYALELEKKEGLVCVHPYNDPKVIAGQGTVGIEVLERVSNLDSIVVPIGGGGLISGIATAAKAMNPKCRVIGAVATGAPAMYDSFKKGKVINYDKTVSTIADGVAVKKVTEEIFNSYISKIVDDIVTVTDDEIAESMVFLMERSKSIVEGAGAMSLAAAQKLKSSLGKKTSLIVSGGNIDMNVIAKVIERGLKKGGRLTRVHVAVPDKPGVLRDLTQIIAESRVNIIQVIHDRTLEGLYIGETAIEFVLETNGWAHIEELEKKLAAKGRIIKSTVKA